MLQKCYKHRSVLKLITFRPAEGRRLSFHILCVVAEVVRATSGVEAFTEQCTYSAAVSRLGR